MASHTAANNHSFTAKLSSGESVVVVLLGNQPTRPLREPSRTEGSDVDRYNDLWGFTSLFYLFRRQDRQLLLNNKEIHFLEM